MDPKPWKDKAEGNPAAGGHKTPRLSLRAWIYGRVVLSIYTPRRAGWSGIALPLIQ